MRKLMTGLLLATTLAIASATAAPVGAEQSPAAPDRLEAELAAEVQDIAEQEIAGQGVTVEKINVNWECKDGDLIVSWTIIWKNKKVIKDFKLCANNEGESGTIEW